MVYKMLVIQFRALCIQGKNSANGVAPSAPPSLYFASPPSLPKTWSLGVETRVLNCFSCLFLHGMWTVNRHIVFDHNQTDITNLALPKSQSCLDLPLCWGCFALLLSYFPRVDWLGTSCFLLAQDSYHPIGKSQLWSFWTGGAQDGRFSNTSLH